ncbi:PP0621 family protein [Candidatus Symbiobacter mobilis]|uniref:Uncharacterized protein n=1 Tax=Candidatus Symbiobacter mobilis CR TaxID=946483 RepID=U5NA16_9BURK|nr:PP0621 family protein [Candidatus Symbiobacter mobilis]AGX88376.1 hypothetical protein Cenrod_2314 [Candidatus Symbiobacter mobilis CR]
MRILWFALIVFLVLWIVAPGLFHKALRRSEKTAPPPPTPTTPQPTTDVVACAFCHLHIPTASAISGRKGVYCCEAHRNEAEGS